MESLKNFAKEWTGVFLSAPFRFLPLQQKIVFNVFDGQQFGDNPKYISDKLRELHPDIKRVWLHKKTASTFPESAGMMVNRPSIRMIYEMSTAKVWVSNEHLPVYIHKRRGQYYIETWHGGLGFKKIEGDVDASELGKAYIEKARHNMRMVNLMISNSKWLTELYRNAFSYKGKILECGFPKEENSYKINPRIVKHVRRFFSIPSVAKIVLYAPTFRGKGDSKESLKYYDLNIQEVLKALRKKTGDSWYALIRLHPALSQYADSFMKYTKYIINASDYPDMQELCMASDMFITDYSSGIFDFALSKRPAFLYASDLEEYENKRGLYFDLRKMPFPFAADTKTLIEKINVFDPQQYRKQLARFYHDMGYIHSNNSAEKIANLIAAVCTRK